MQREKRVSITIREAIERQGRARIEMSIVLLLTAITGAASCVLLYRVGGIEQMWLRYGLSVLPAYFIFFCLVGVWVFLNRDHQPRTHLLESERPNPDAINPFEALEGVPDAGEGCAVILFLVLFLGVIATAAAAIYYAPVFLAELLLETAFAGSLYRGLLGLPLVGWPRLLFRRTWVVAIFAILLFAGIGGLLQSYAPEAQSIGGVIEHWMK